MRDVSDVIPFWGDLTEFEKSILLKETRWMKFSRGQFASSVSDSCLGALFIEKGQFRTYITSEEGREVTLFRLQSGDTSVLSASCVMSHIAFDVSMMAMEETEVLLLPSKRLDWLMKENLRVELFFSKLANQRFSDVMWTMQQILFLGVDKRLAIFLWDEIVGKKSDSIKFTHDEIASFIGSAREVVSRTLKMFQDDGIVELSRGLIKVTDREKLKNLCR